MVKEAKKSCYGQWNYPAGHLEEFYKEEILDVKWISIEDIKKMKKEELRGYEIGIKTIDDIENNKIYPLDIFDNNKYNS